MRKAFWWSVAGYAVVLIVCAAVLPADGVVLHSGWNDPDRYGTSAELVGVMAGVGAGVALLFAVLGRTMAGRIDLTSPIVNLPHKAWWTSTPERVATARRMLADDLYGFGAATMVFLSLMLVATQGLAAWVTAVLAGIFVLAALGWCAYLMTRRYRPAEPEHDT